MSEEEIEAIKYLEILSNEKCECEACQRAKKEYKIILNLLDGQQKEIKDLVRIINKQLKEIEELKKQNYEIVIELKPRVQIDDTEYIERNFISKDKIRELKEKVEKNKQAIRMILFI